jgi:acetate kinase
VSLLTVNVGSSSVRLAAYDRETHALAEQHVEGNDAAEAGELLRRFAQQSSVVPVEAVAHRVVHGGERFRAATRIDSDVEAEIDRLSELAPLHNPPALAWIRAARARFPDVPQVAVFDTAFFAQLPLSARTYAIAADLAARLRVRRYGFHGLAHRFLWQSWDKVRARGAGGRVISLQLGSGCSIAAIRDGAPLDTSMGFSPLEGLVMATRCGDIDPGLLVYLQRHEGWSPAELERRLNYECGLAGLSGESGDVRKLLASSHPAARLALEVFCYRARKYVGAYLAVLGGADAILFGGGIGEHAPALRASILQGMEWAGIALDATRNQALGGSGASIAAHGAAIDVRVIAVDESLILAAEARTALASDAAAPP